MVGAGAAQLVDAPTRVAQTVAALLLVEFGEETGPLGRRGTGAADDVPQAVVDDIVTRVIGVCGEAHVGHVTRAVSWDVAASLPARLAEDEALAAAAAAPGALCAIAATGRAPGEHPRATGRGGAAHPYNVGRVGR